MSSSYVVKNLLELNEKIDSMSDEEIKKLFKNKPIHLGTEYDYLCKNVLGLESENELEVLDVYSPEFLRKT